MNEIIPYLYLGSASDAENVAALEAAGIERIVNCCTYQEYPIFRQKPKIQYLRVDIEDISKEPIHLFFKEAGDFIDACVGSKNPILVHCKAGVSRSASVIISYLVGYRGFRLQEAFFHVLTKRRIVCPNLGFMEQLCEYEKEIHNTQSVCLYKYRDWYTADLDYRPAIPDLEP